MFNIELLKWSLHHRQAHRVSCHDWCPWSEDLHGNGSGWGPSQSGNFRKQNLSLKSQPYYRRWIFHHPENPMASSISLPTPSSTTTPSAIAINCGPGGGSDNHFHLRIAAIFIILICSTFGAVFPIIARRSSWLHVPKPAFEYVSISDLIIDSHLIII